VRHIQQRILVICGEKVILDAGPADFHGVSASDSTSRLSATGRDSAGISYFSSQQARRRKCSQNATTFRQILQQVSPQTASPGGLPRKGSRPQEPAQRTPPPHLPHQKNRIWTPTSGSIESPMISLLTFRPSTIDSTRSITFARLNTFSTSK